MELYLGDFQGNSLEGWKPKQFSGETKYRLTKYGESTVLEARSNASASGLFKEIEVDIKKYPYLNWSWMITRLLQGNNEREKAGDDFPVRLYVLVSTGPFFWQTKALNYVWSRNEPLGMSWINPFTDSAVMLAVESGGDHLNQWVTHKRNVREDLKRYLGIDADSIQGVALMVDTDNTGQQALSYFGDIFFARD